MCTWVSVLSFIPSLGITDKRDERVPFPKNLPTARSTSFILKGQRVAQEKNKVFTSLPVQFSAISVYACLHSSIFVNVFIATIKVLQNNTCSLLA